jgi:hypothetical protein
MKLHEFWRATYRHQRYLADVDLDIVTARMRHLVENLTILTEGAKIGVRPVEGSDEALWIAFTHTLEELVLRGANPPKGFMDGASIPKPRGRGPRAIEAARTYPGALTGRLVKYGRRDDVRAMHDAGVFRVCPASFYNDPSLNPARSDDELSVTFFAQPRDVAITTMDGRPIEPIRPVELSFRTQADYYVWCCSKCYDYRLFDDFDADACLVIFDSERFARLLIEALEARKPGWMGLGSSVNYIDPYQPSSDGRPFVQMTKHFRHYYQQEYRVVWLPPKPEECATLEPLFVELGDLEGLADVIALD